MKKIFVFAIFVLAHSFCIAAQQPVSPVTEPGNFGEYRADQNTNNAAIQSNFTELYGSVGTLTSALNGKASISCFTNSTTAAACGIDLDWLGTGVGDNLGSATAANISSLFSGTGDCLGSNGQKVACGSGTSFDQAGDYTFTGTLDFSGASVTGLSGGSMVYPSAAGVAVYGGSSAWGTSLSIGTSANNLVQLNGSAQLPAVSAALLTNFPTLNQNTTGSAARLGTARTIAGSSFDGTANIDISYGNLLNRPTIPDELADLATDTANQRVSATEKSTWNAKQDAVQTTAFTAAVMGWTSQSAFETWLGWTFTASGASEIADITDWPAGVTATELSYLDGVTSDIQGQINALSAGSGGTVTVVTSDPYSDIACTGAKYNSANDRFFPCLGGYHVGYVGLTDWSNPQPVTRTLTVTSPSNGTITCSDSDLSTSINCGTGGAVCSATAADGASIAGITATADSGYALSAWAGDLSGTTNPTTLTMSTNRSIGATFALEQTYEGDTCSGYTTCQNLEGTGYDNSETWFTTLGSGGSVDPDEAVVVGRGSQSLEIVAGITSTNAYKYITAAPEVHEHFMFRMSALPSANNTIIASAKDTSGNSKLVLYMSTGGILKVDIGSTQASAISGVSANTWYHVWIDAVNGTGNATASLYVATVVDGVDTAKPGSPVAAVTTGTSTVNFDRIFFFAGGGMTNYFDHILTKTTAIGGVVQ